MAVAGGGPGLRLSVTRGKIAPKNTCGDHIFTDLTKFILCSIRQTSSQAPMPGKTPAKALGLPDVIERIAIHSRRPRYAFLVLNLIAKAAGDGDSAGPYP